MSIRTDAQDQERLFLIFLVDDVEPPSELVQPESFWRRLGRRRAVDIPAEECDDGGWTMPSQFVSFQHALALTAHARRISDGSTIATVSLEDL